MTNYEMDLKLLELHKELAEVRKILDKAMTHVSSDKELWDNADVKKNWHVSDRTLADWRKKGLISYIKVQNKIWYPQDARGNFLKNHAVRVRPNNRRAL